VATRALDQLVLEEQGIGGFPVVIELCLFPIPFDVAIIALASETTPMRVVLLVAGIAQLWRFLVLVIQVAFDALHIAMPTEQSVGSFVVIENNRLPCLLGVATFTVRSHHALVLVAFFVAFVANGWCLAIFLVCLVATFAGDFGIGMTILQRVVRLGMIEFRLIEGDD
jgi:hypothetical protein